MLPWAPAQQACKLELVDESDIFRTRARGGAGPLSAIPTPHSPGQVAAPPLPHPASLLPTSGAGNLSRMLCSFTLGPTSCYRLSLEALPLQSGSQQSRAGLALLSLHCLPTSGLGTQQGPRMAKSLARVPL